MSVESINIHRRMNRNKVDFFPFMAEVRGGQHLGDKSPKK